MEIKLFPGLTAFLFIIGCVYSKDVIDPNVECVFREYSRCYQDIASLGANVSAVYDSTIQQVNATCKSEISVSSCLQSVVGKCDPNHQYPSLIGLTDRIISTVKDICKNGSLDQGKFLNSSQCQNKYRHVRLKCVHENDIGNKQDAKSICCSAVKTVRCLQSEFKFLCPWPDIQFHNQLTETYFSPKYVPCSKYTQNCNGVTRQEISWTLVWMAIFSIFWLKRTMD